ncbi:MAG TPA: cytochrome ubiquinol oxidase subunit I [Pirellulales bacterium]|nr:cytochrome ubiquinol oxidase subunit I [Pirellulales bacterium]
MDDVLLLSRIQFALTIMFHYLFPPLSIGLGAIMVLMEGIYLRTGDLVYHNMTRFWSRVFAVNFAVGVATGIVMEFEFGSNWARYSRYVGDVFGSALAAEGIFAFFLESGFLAVLVFGWDRVGKRMHFFATLMVALGSIFSAVWIVVANSWMHTPAGYEVQSVVNPDGAVVTRAVINDFWAMVFNPSSVNRLVHVVLGAFLQGAFFVMSIAAYYVLGGRHLDFAKRSFTVAIVFGGISSVAIALSGHEQGRAVAHNQPAKLAAMEGHFKSGPATLYALGLPDAEHQRVNFGLGIPGGLSFMVHNDFGKSLPGLDRFDPADRPPDKLLPVIFTSYHMMAGIGTLLMLLSLVGLFFRWRGTLFERRWLLRAFVVAVFGPFICNQCGWVAAEVGRQPFIVYPEVTWQDDETPTMNTHGTRPGMRTEHGLSSQHAVGPRQVVQSIVMFSLVYLLLFIVWVHVLNDKIQHGPDPLEPPPSTTSPTGLLQAATANKPAGGESLTRADDSVAIDGGA